MCVCVCVRVRVRVHVRALVRARERARVCVCVCVCLSVWTHYFCSMLIKSILKDAIMLGVKFASILKWCFSLK